MNYRHAFHAGNFADVVKHAALAYLLALIAAKAKPIVYLDLHAGAGRYDLASVEAFRTRESKSGVERIWQAAAGAPPPLAPYLEILARENRDRDAPLFYPGSPAIAGALLREDDRLLLFEKHPQDCAALTRLLSEDRRARIECADGWIAPKALLPPPERRGMILIDPPFEETEDWRRMPTALAEGHRRFSTGVFMLWYPIKDDDAVAALKASIHVAKCLCVEFLADEPATALRGTGLLIVNPTWPFAEAFPEALNFLAETLHGRASCSWLNA